MNTEHEKKFNWLTSLFTNWGIKEIWAKVLAGIIVGILAAIGLSGCSAGMTFTVKSDHGEVTWTLDGENASQSAPVIIPQKK